MSLLVRVVPRAGVTKLDGTRDGRLLVRLAAPPVDGAANDALVSYLARILAVPIRSISVAAGARSRNKQLSISGITADRVRTLTSPRS